MKITSTQKQMTRELILKHAFEAFIQQDYEKIKLSAISKACNIGEGTLYNYFKDKPTLFIATFIHYRGRENHVFAVYKPIDFQGFIDEIIEILDHYMRIDHPRLERAFMRFIHLVREQQLMSKPGMEEALSMADQFIYDAVLALLDRTPIKLTATELLFEVIVKHVEGIFNDFLYGSISFDSFLLMTKEHLKWILRPYVDLP